MTTPLIKNQIGRGEPTGQLRQPKAVEAKLVPYQIEGLTAAESESLFDLLNAEDKSFFESTAFAGDKSKAEGYNQTLKKLGQQNIRVKVKPDAVAKLLGNDMGYLESRLRYEEGYSNVYLSFSENGGILMEVDNGGEEVMFHEFNSNGYRHFIRYILETWRTDKTAIKLPEAKSTKDAVNGVMDGETKRKEIRREFFRGFDTVEQAKAFLIAKGLPESEMWIGTRPGTPENKNPDPYYTIYIKGHNGTTWDKGVAMKGINPIPLTYTVNIGGKFSVHLAVDTIELLKTR